jgi:two-component system phosphate regulon response regulator OmpR
VKRILIVDDDLDLAHMLAEYLAVSAYQVNTWASGLGVEQQLQHYQPDLLILDAVLPDADGLDILRRLTGQLPILMLSGRGSVFDRVLGLELGADDYLAKPFDARELLARVKVLLRRGRMPQEAQIVTFGEFSLDLKRRTLSRNGQSLALTTAEFALLKCLALHPGRLLSREDMLNLTTQEGSDRLPFDRSIDARIARLRRRLGDDPNAPRYIRTVWGGGYVFIGLEPAA